MDRKQLLQTRRLVGWWLNIPTSHLIGDDSKALGHHLSDIHNVINSDALDQVFENSKIDMKRRRRYLEAALSGIALSEIAKKEDVRVGAVSSLVRDTLTRLALNRTASKC